MGDGPYSLLLLRAGWHEHHEVFAVRGRGEGYQRFCLTPACELRPQLGEV